MIEYQNNIDMMAEFDRGTKYKNVKECEKRDDIVFLSDKFQKNKAPKK